MRLSRSCCAYGDSDFLVVAVIGSCLVNQSVLDEGSDFVSSDDELPSLLEGNALASGVVGEPAVAGPSGVGSVESPVNISCLAGGELTVDFVFDADSCKVPS